MAKEQVDAFIKTQNWGTGITNAMKSKRHRRTCPFVALSLRELRDLYVRLRWKIRCEAPHYGGRFTSPLVMEDDRPDLYNQWFDFYFLSRGRFTIWNACIYTARAAFWETVSDLALERALDMLSPAEREEEHKLEFIPADFRNGQRLYTLKKKPIRTYAKFGGLSFNAYWEKLGREIIRDEPPAIHELFSAYPSYRYGIGLHVIVDADRVDRSAIEQAINRFYEIGEKDWRSPMPVPRERLPYESEKEALAKVAYPSVLLGQKIRD